MFRFYDDELQNLILVAHRDVREIISYTANYDYHPPLQYLFNKIFLELFGLNEFLLKLPSIILIIIAIILCSHLVFKITGAIKLSLLCGLITITNPLLLLWGASLRWYPLWTFLAVLSIYLLTILFSDTKNKKRIFIQSLLIFTLTLALYTNYQTIILITGLLITAIFLDVKLGFRKFTHLKRTLPAIIAVIILFLPYLNVFLNHIETFFYRKEIYSDYSIHSTILAGCYFIFSILFGNSIYPWDIRFIVLISITVIALAGSIFYYKSHSSRIKITIQKSILYQEKKNLLFLLSLISTILFILFLIQSIITGSFLSRGFLIFSFLFPILIIVYLSYLSKIKDNKLLSLIMFTVLSFFLIWSISSYNVLTRQSLHKSGLMDPVEKVTSFINKITELNKPNYIVITFDPVLTYYLINPESMNNKITIFSPYKDETTALINSFSGSMDNSPIYLSTRTKILFIDSYPGSLMPLIGKIENFKRYLFEESIQQEKPRKFGFDENAEIKRKFFPSAGMIDWRYTIYSIVPKSTLDINILASFDSLKVY